MRFVGEPALRSLDPVGTRLAGQIVKANEWDTEPNKHTGRETAFRHIRKTRKQVTVQL